MVRYLHSMIRVSDPGTFIKEIVGTEGRFTTEEVTEFLEGAAGHELAEAARFQAGAAHEGADRGTGHDGRLEA